MAAFARREGGGFGLAVGFARRAIRSLTGLELNAPISGQRALRGELLPALLPFAPGFGMETAMTIDAAAPAPASRSGARPRAPRDRATLAGFVHRGRQLADFVRVCVAPSAVAR